MPLKTEADGGARRFTCVSLEPPGNIAREIALYRRRLFSILLEPSALAFPETVALAFGSARRDPEASARRFRAKDSPMGSPKGGPGGGVRSASRLLGESWTVLDGPLSTGAPVAAGRGIYLQVFPRLDGLGEKAKSALVELGFPLSRAAPIVAGLGFFLIAVDDSERGLAAAVEAGAPLLSFRDCSLILSRLSAGPDPLRALYWRELARSARRVPRGA